jgi:hypothetical protein
MTFASPKDRLAVAQQVKLLHAGDIFQSDHYHM